MQTEWVDLSKVNPAPDYLVERYGKVFAQILYNRRDLFSNFSKDAVFPELKNLTNYSYFYSLNSVALKLADYVKKGSSIVVYGDYDADGISL